METLLAMALTNGLLAALLAATAWAAGRAFPGRPALAHALWLLVLLKLITPPVVSIGLGWGRSSHDAAPDPEPAAAADDCCPRAAPEVEVAAPPPPGEAPARWPAWLLGAWLAGTALLWALAARRIRRVVRLFGELPPAPDEVQAEVGELAARLGLRRAPLALFFPAGCGLPPLVFALVGRPRLGLPVELWLALDGPQRRTVLLHELAHLRRGDHWVRWLELLALGLYWWHPVAWWAAARLRHAEELCCDAWVVWAEPEHAADYAAALVEAAALLSVPRPRLPGVCAASPVVDLERRLVMILQARTRRRLSLATAAILLVAGAALLPMAPTLASPEKRVEGMTIADADPQRLAASLRSCQACHEAKQKPRTKGDDLHAEIIRLMQEVKSQKARLRQSEDALKRALDRFEKEQGPKLPPASPAAQPERGKDRLADLEMKLDQVMREVEALRKERAAQKPRSDVMPRR